MKYKIMAQGPLKIEEVDTADNKNEADYLVKEYRMAFGPLFIVWKVKWIP